MWGFAYFLSFALVNETLCDFVPVIWHKQDDGKKGFLWGIFVILQTPKMDVINWFKGEMQVMKRRPRQIVLWHKS